MAKLKAGTVRNLKSDTLAGAMDAEFVAQWASLDKDTELPTDTRALEDRRLMFVAIARGLLTYFYDHRHEIETSDESTGVSGSEHYHQLEFDWE